jgi:hypothetical protein
MMVKTHFDGREIVGLYIGVRNARQKFPKDVKDIELVLGHLHIHCELPPEFWRGQPEIRDPRLCDWLQSKILHGQPRRTPVPLEMLPTGNNTFRLQTIKLPPASGNGLAKIGPTAALSKEANGKPVSSGTASRARGTVHPSAPGL